MKVSPALLSRASNETGTKISNNINNNIKATLNKPAQGIHTYARGITYPPTFFIIFFFSLLSYFHF